MKTIKVIGIVTGSIIVLALIIVGVVWFMMSRPSKLTKNVTPVVANTAAAQSLDTKWQTFQDQIAQAATPTTIVVTQQVVDSSKPGTPVTVTVTQTEVRTPTAGIPISVTLTQEEVDSKINDGLKTVNLPPGLTIGKMNVNLTDGKLLLAATVQYSVLSGNAGMVASVDLVNGQPVITVTNIDLGALPFPQSLKDQLKNLIPQDALFQTNNSFQAHSIIIANGLLTIQGVTK